MKKLIVMYLSIALIREVAKYYKIKTFEDVMKLVMPTLEDLLPEVNHKAKQKQLDHA